ncbi:MAG: hypothetical protein HY820_40900 [Acidobacteria bacterium]|nr:hypothetical protein [Acidobacteriota bacterium]
MKLLLTFLLLGSLEANAAEVRRKTWWKASLVALVTSTSIDAGSSWGRLEANPLLRNGDGRFGAQGVALKAVILGGVAGAQYLMLRKHPHQEKYAAITNFALSGVLTAAAVSNIRRDRYSRSIPSR